MAASFIAMEVVNSVGGGFDNGELLVNKDNILSIQQNAADTVKIFVAEIPTREVTITLSTSRTGAVVAPIMADEGLGTKAFNYALTANPGGVKAKVFLGKDDNGAQMYVRNVTFV